MVLGRLLYVSTYFPRLPGGLMAASGFGYLADAMTLFLRPDRSPLGSCPRPLPAVVSPTP